MDNDVGDVGRDVGIGGAADPAKAETQSGADQPEPAKTLRADAARNRQKLVDVAREAFADKGAATSLEEIARSAGVGIGTLYRHFPTRDALIEEVYRSASQQLTTAAATLMAERAPADALREWLLLFVDHMATKKLMADALASLVGGPGALYASSGGAVTTAITTLMQHAEQSGAIRVAMDPLDLLRAIAGVANNVPGSHWEESARRLVDILMAGMRPERS
ncbi:MAG TPA: TetR/AcrR family transcriptional regulator [Gemmatimonas aurantiaca]|uniref:TetR/AcrR family transcriptional regulator n=1 Tax=Gemmatimonas aurantiaca TaxID=173480 RepID=A0A3D4VA18_9BACT|nr:TetR/AcrR family transcriptional regulator [Gemmatimonas aurantiaca]HCT57973.1 TetR/AcrR family transcriptional regulator [Gemmatimonas aurantiaca]